MEGADCCKKMRERRADGSKLVNQEVQSISESSYEAQRNPFGPDDIAVEV